MGSTTFCSIYCDSSSQNSKRKQLKNKYKEGLRGSRFRNLCINTLDRYFNQELEFQEQEFLRKSIVVHASHYETNSLVNSLITEDSLRFSRRESGEFEERVPTSILGISSEKKDGYALNLIRQSYLFVDLSECMEEQKTNQAYQKLLQHEILQSDKSLLQSFTEESNPIDRLQYFLKVNEAEMVCLLEGYVRFCRKVKHDFQPENDRFLGKLCLNLQGQIISDYKAENLSNKNQLLIKLREDIDEVIAIQAVTVQNFFQFKSRNQPAQITQTEENFNFYNQINIHTMISCLFFENEQFSSVVVDKIKECFAEKFNKFKMEHEYTQTQFVNDFVSFSSKGGQTITQKRSVLDQLFDPRAKKYNDIQVFPKSRKILRKIDEKQSPLFKLKLIYEFNKQMNKQLQILKEQLSTRYDIELTTIFNRQTQLLIIKWILNQERRQIDRLGSHILFTYFFIHPCYKMDRKGSCLTTFIQEIERIIQWNQQ